MTEGDYQPVVSKAVKKQALRLRLYALFHTKYLPFLLYHLLWVEIGNTCVAGREDSLPENLCVNCPIEQKAVPVSLIVSITLWSYLLVDLGQVFYSLKLSTRNRKLTDNETFGLYTLVTLNIVPLMLVMSLNFPGTTLNICAGTFLTEDQRSVMMSELGQAVFIPQRASFLWLLSYSTLA